MTGTVHVIGAGLAGLAAAVTLARAGRRVMLHEAAPQAGGRCRSYLDATLGLTIDNGNHLLLSANQAALGFLEMVGARDALIGPDEAAFPFLDLRSGESWTLRLNDGPLPWWIFSRKRRVPGTRASDYAAPLGILLSRRDRPIGEVMACAGPLYDRLWGPVLLAGLNIDPAEGSTRLAAAMIRESMAAGGRMCRPLVARQGLSHAFVDPALATLQRAGAGISFGRRLRALNFGADRVTALQFMSEIQPLGPQDQVVLAVPPGPAAEILPGLTVPERHCPILNLHYKVAPPPGMPPFIGLVGGTAEWVFGYPDRLSVTISGADRLMDESRQALAEKVWAELQVALGITMPLPLWQVVKEKRATFAATPAENARRPQAKTGWRNLALAGDWTATGLPATIEGAIRSGNRAAALVLAGG